jgi:uncharacterized protein with HEPN domain
LRSRDFGGAIRDALAAAEWAVAFCAGVTAEQFIRDEATSSAVERKLEIIGEALSRAGRADAALADAVPDLHRIIGFRNVLAHGYEVVDPHEIYLIVTTSVPDLIETLRSFPGLEAAE